MTRAGIFLVLVLALLFGAAGARAGDATDCQTASDPNTALAACTNLIKAGGAARVIAIAHYNRAKAYRRLGDSDRAIADFTNSIRINPSLFAAYNDRGLTFLQTGKNDKAIADFNAAIKVNPDFAVAYANRGIAVQRSAQHEAALADFDKAIELDPSISDTYNARAISRAATGDHANAIADYDLAISIEPENPEYLNNRADSYRLTGELDRAISDLDIVIDKIPSFAPAWYTRGEAYLDKQDYAQAEADIVKAMELDTDWGFVDYGKTLIAEIARKSNTVPETPPEPAVIDGEMRVALVIANSKYQSVQALENPPNDAETIAAALRATGFDLVTVVHDLDRDGMVEALKAFTEEADKADWAVIYFAGHGVEVSGTNYLVPVDAKFASDRDVPDEAVSLDRVIAAIEGARKMRIVILDACRNNPFLVNMKTTSATRAIGRGLALVEPSQATLVAFAAKAGSIASDGDSTNSPFAASLAKHVTQAGVEINKVFRLVRSDVLAATNNGQEPFVYGSLPPEDFFFVPPKS
jgi:tetratricopeptide (TPR) repeat protein